MKLVQICMKFDQINAKLSEIVSKFMQMKCNHNHKRIHYQWLYPCY